MAEQSGSAIAPQGSKEDFVAAIYPAVREVSAETGMSWELMLSQAAQETEWGKRLDPDTFNVFNRRAGADWQGSSKTLAIPEFVDGERRVVDVDIRAYASYQEAFRDHARALSDDPRFANADVFAHGGLEPGAAALQRGGYSTDPLYAERLAETFNGCAMQRALEQLQESRLAPLSITDQTHPQHLLFAEVSRRIAERSGHEPRPEVAAAIALQMFRNGIRDPGDMQGLAVSGNEVHVQGPNPGARVSFDMTTAVDSIESTSEKFLEQGRDQASPYVVQQREQPPGSVLS